MKGSESEDVSIVFIGSLKSIRGSEFTNLAYQDNYNSNYRIIKNTTSLNSKLSLMEQSSCLGLLLKIFSILPLMIRSHIGSCRMIGLL